MNIIIQNLIKLAFTFDQHTQSLNYNNYRVYFDDNNIVVIEFDNNKSILWKNYIDSNMPTNKIIKTIKMLIS